ncbi:MAG: YihY/virulence factor BrkB family protein, partial [Bacillota bacterium]|nr:YihY/virulence factor BrkB family protein [Bacillota bacterium]
EVTANHNLSLLSIGVLTAFWAAINGAKALILGINIAYGNPPSKGFFRPYLIAALATVGIPLIVVVTLVFQVAGETIAQFLENYFHQIEFVITLIKRLGTVIPIVTTGIYFLLFYRLAPNVEVRFRDVIFGTVFATTAWFGASYLFSIYINQFANYSRFYGSIGSVIMLLFWLYITSMIILLGAEINAAMAGRENRRK